jgi:hypothetical protein
MMPSPKQIAAMKAGPKMDALILAAGIFKTEWHHDSGADWQTVEIDGESVWASEFHPSTNIADAMQVLEKFWAYGIDWCRGTIPEGTVTIIGRNGKEISASGDSPALVICRAALLATMEEG